MKKILTTISIIIFTNLIILSAQNISFNDPQFKKVLVTNKVIDTDFDGILDSDVDINDDNEISLQEAEQVISMTLTAGFSIADVSEISYFKNIKIFYFLINNVKKFPDILKNPKLEKFSFTINTDSIINIQSHPNLKYCKFYFKTRTKKIQMNNNLNLKHIEFYPGINVPMPEIDSIDLASNSLDTFICPFISTTFSKSYVNCSSNYLKRSSIGAFSKFFYVNFSNNRIANIGSYNSYFKFEGNCLFLNNNEILDFNVELKNEVKEIDFTNNPIKRFNYKIGKNIIDGFDIDTFKDLEFIRIYNEGDSFIEGVGKLSKIEIQNLEHLKRIELKVECESTILLKDLPSIDTIYIYTNSKVQIENIFNNKNIINPFASNSVTVKNRIIFKNSLKGKIKIDNINYNEIEIIENPLLESIGFGRNYYGSSLSFSLLLQNNSNLKKIENFVHYQELNKVYIKNNSKLDTLIININKLNEFYIENTESLRHFYLRGVHPPIYFGKEYSSLISLSIAPIFVSIRDLPNLEFIEFLDNYGRIVSFELNNLPNLISIIQNSKLDLNNNLPYNFEYKNLPKLKSINLGFSSSSFDRIIKGNLFEISNLPSLETLTLSGLFYFESIIISNIEKITNISIIEARFFTKNMEIYNLQNLKYLKFGSDLFVGKMKIFNLISLESFFFQGRVDDLNINDNYNLKTIDLNYVNSKNVKLVNLPKLRYYRQYNTRNPSFNKLISKSNLILKELSSLERIELQTKNIDTIDFTECPLIDTIIFYGWNTFDTIRYLNLKNGNKIISSLGKNVSESSNYYVQKICVDNDDESEIVKGLLKNPNFSSFTKNCNSTYNYAYFEGKVFIKDTTTANHSPISTFFPIKVEDNNNPSLVYTNSFSEYSYSSKSLNEEIIIYPILDTSFFKLSSNIHEYYPNEHREYLNQNFTLVNKQPIEDVQAYIHILDTARPGNKLNCIIEIKNSSSIKTNATFNFKFDSKFMSIISSNNLLLTDTMTLRGMAIDLPPYSSYMFPVTFLLNKPTDNKPLNGGELLEFNIEANSSLMELNIENNVFKSIQRVVNSHDPNNILCAQGDRVAETDDISTLVYTINFENLGNGNAEQIKVTNIIDTFRLALNSFNLINFSHNANVSLNGDKILFDFKNINLSYVKDLNKGFVTYSIRPKIQLSKGDSIYNEANIFFDYNLPIPTNKHLLTVDGSSLTTSNQDDIILIYPNPNSGTFYLDFSYNKIRNLKIYNLMGKQIFSLLEIKSNEVKTELNSGTYIVVFEMFHGQKIIKKISIVN